MENFGGITLDEVIVFQTQIMMGAQFGRIKKEKAMQEDIIIACLRMGWNDAFRHTSENTKKEEHNKKKKDCPSILELSEKEWRTKKEHFEDYDDFICGNIRKLENYQETKSSLNITYQSSSSKLISMITDGVGRVYTFTYSSGLLTKIAYKGSSTSEITSITYSHDNTKNLSRISYPDNKYVTFVYEAGSLLSLVKGIDTTDLDYTYNTTISGLPNRINSVKLINRSTNVTNGTLNIEYSNNQTTFFDGENTVIMQFNDLGNTVSIQDSDGKAQFTEYAINSEEETSESYTKNQLTLSSKLQSTVVNLIKGSSMENDTNWICYRTSNTGNTGSYGYSSSVKYMGNKSVYLTRTSNTGVYMIQQRVDSFITVEPGKSYTFSAYIKTTGMNNTNPAGSGAQLIVEAQVSGNPIVKSEAVKKNSDWNRYSVTYYADPAYGPHSIKVFVQNGSIGTAYFDCLQFEEGQNAGRYNLLENSDFTIAGTTADTAYGWTESASCDTNDVRGQFDIDNAGKLDSYVYSIQGDATSNKEVYQTITMNGYAGEIFTFAGWAKGDSVPTEDGTRDFALSLTFTYTDGTTGTTYIRFNTDTDSNNNWQYVAGKAVALKNYSSIKVAVVYKNNVNTVYFDGIQLYMEEFGYSYFYDDEGNVTSVVDLQGYITSYEYEDNELTKAILPTGAIEQYTYDQYHNVRTALTEEGLEALFLYDEYGNNTDTYLNGVLQDEDGYDYDATIYSYAEYTEDGNYIAYVVDPNFNESRYGYNLETGVLEWYQAPEDSAATRTEYEYDTLYRLTDTTKAVSGLTGGLTEITNSYTYNNDLLTTITHSNTEDLSTVYTFTYGIFNLLQNIKVGNRTLINYEYTSDATGYNLTKSRYGNGSVISYEYDELERIISVKYDNHTSPDIEYEYDKDGNLTAVHDHINDITTRYHYDTTGRVRISENKTEIGIDSWFKYTYDELNNISLIEGYYDGIWSDYAYTYDSDNRIVNVEYDWGDIRTDYDGLGRVSKITKNYGHPMVSEFYTYQDIDIGEASTLVSSMKSIAYLEMGSEFGFSYTYDQNGNIIEIIDDSSNVSDAIYRTTYEYDEASQLIRENNQRAGKTWVYTYDAGGNITQKKEYSYTTSTTLATVLDTITYTYGDSNWPNLLTNYNGTPSTSDLIGNLLYDGEWTYTWQQGRQLAYMNDGHTFLSFKYNADGLRCEKTVDDTTWRYVYHGSKLIYMTDGEQYLEFYYDTNRPIGFYYNEEMYYYVFNLQGDIIAIVDDYSRLQVRYYYDAWGNIVYTYGQSVDTIGEVNPFRYRGYYYDGETGLYYLQSRYYNPKTGRFINADNNLSNYNLFMYCENNPVNRYDPNGEHWYYLWLDDLKEGLEQLMASVSNIVYGKAAAERSIIDPKGAQELWKSRPFQDIKPSQEMQIFTKAMCDLDITVDVSVSVNIPWSELYAKVGVSKVISPNKNIDASYIHVGVGRSTRSKIPVSVSYSVGIVRDVYKKDDYAGPFWDMGITCGYGLDYCGYPGGASAFSGSISYSYGIYCGYDYYWCVN